MNYEVHSIVRDSARRPVAIIERTDLREPLYKALTAAQIAEGVSKHMTDLSLSHHNALHMHNMRGQA